MAYTRLLIGDANVARFWPAAQVARPQLMGVNFREASCSETLSAALSEVTDTLDPVIISVLSEFLIEEASALDISQSCSNIVGDVFRALERSAKRSSNVQVIDSLCLKVVSSNGLVNVA